MSRKIESLLRVIADLKHFEDGTMPEGHIGDFPDKELSFDELDLIAAAAQNPVTEFPWEKKK